MTRKTNEFDALNRVLKKKQRKEADEVLPIANENDETTKNTPDSSSPGVAASVWNCLTPNTRKSTAIKLQNSSPSARPTRAIRKELGVNLSKQFSPPNRDGSALCQEIKDFFDQDEVSVLCPDKKQLATNPLTKEDEAVQVRFRTSRLYTLYCKFVATRNKSCEFRTFQKYVPFYIKRANPLDWGTCMCEYCVNPELKFISLKNQKLLEGDFEEKTSEENIDNFIKEVGALKDETRPISFIAWEKVENPLKPKTGKKANKLTRKVSHTLPLNGMIKLLLKELEVLKSHLFRMHQQFKKFKAIRTEVLESDGDSAAMHMDWSENARVRQAKESKSAYYHEDHVSIHCIRSMQADGETSYVSLADTPNHMAEAVWASIKPVLEQYVEDGVKHVYAISDSPTNQYRNQKIFYLMKKFCEEHGIDFTWVYLEAGHGKGVPDGLGAAAKRAVRDLMGDNPLVPIYTVYDLIEHGYCDYLPSIEVLIHTEEAIADVLQAIPPFHSATGTMKIHEVTARAGKKSVQLYSKFHSGEAVEKTMR